MKHLTVVYTIANEAVFASEMAKLSEQYTDINDKPWSITAMSTDNEIRRLELVEQAVGDEDLDIVNAILSHSDIGNVKSLEDL